jgi:hypothetical protein
LFESKRRVNSRCTQDTAQRAKRVGSEKEGEASLWTCGPLGPNCHHSDLDPTSLMHGTRIVLDGLVEGRKADFEMIWKEWTIEGRFNSIHGETCSWAIHIYRANMHKRVHKSVLEIRCVGDQDMAFLNLTAEFIDILTEKKFIKSESPLCMIEFLDTDEDDMVDMNLEDSDIEMTMDSELTAEEKDEQREEQSNHAITLAKELSKTTLEESTLRYCVTTLVSYLESDPQVLKLVAKESPQMVKLAFELIFNGKNTTITDTMSIISLLKICEALIHAGLVVKETCPSDMKTLVEKIKDIWSKSVRIEVAITGFILKYPRSQQVVYACEDILRVLPK